MITGPLSYRDFRETSPWVGNKQYSYIKKESIQADGNTDDKQKMYSGLKYQINLSVCLNPALQK